MKAFLFLLILQPLTLLGQEFSVKDSQSKEPIPYTLIKVIDHNIGAVSNEAGNFKLNINLTGLTKIHVSSVGYRDTTILLSHGIREIYLVPRPIVLKEFELTEKRVETVTVGDLQSEGLTYYQDDKPIKWTLQQHIYSGIFTNEKVKKGARLGSIHIFFTEVDTTETFLLRLFAGPKKFQFHRMYNSNQLTELLSKNVIISPKKTGWYEIELSEFRISYPPTGVFIFLHPSSGGDYDINSPNLSTCIGSYPLELKLRSHYRASLNGGVVYGLNWKYVNYTLRPAVALVLDIMD